MNSPTAIWLNGLPAHESLAASRALHYGDGVFRTCLIYGSQIIDISMQIDKLISDAAALGLKPPARDRLAAEARAAAAGHRGAVLKLLLLRRGEARGYRPQENRANSLMLLYPAPEYDPRCWTRGVAIAPSAFRLAVQPRLAGIKHLNRLEQVLASAAWPGKADEAILCDTDGNVVSGSRTNLFWAERGALFTPRLDRCGVSGLTRAKVIRLAHSHRIVPGGPVTEVRARWEDVVRAEEVFLTNSLVGIWPVRRLGRRRLGAPGPVTQSLMTALGHPGPA